MDVMTIMAFLEAYAAAFIIVKIIIEDACVAIIVTFGIASFGYGAYVGGLDLDNGDAVAAFGEIILLGYVTSIIVVASLD
mmetsp:Transcript_29128/g.26539  ORF Transcript_29128/g.26539 Transcript_29128/m.26539 type:complete len:80 (+) Transcript_29128:1435-1674(+)